MVVVVLLRSAGIASSSALFMGVGSLLAIPVAFVTDYLMRGITPNGWSLGGAACVLVAFLILSCSTAAQAKARPVDCSTARADLAHGAPTRTDRLAPAETAHAKPLVDGLREPQTETPRAEAAGTHGACWLPHQQPGLASARQTLLGPSGREEGLAARGIEE
jgi:hypothetical protein